MITIEQIRDLCASVKMSCKRCPIAVSKDRYCPLVSEEPADWDIVRIDGRYRNSRFNKERRKTVRAQRPVQQPQQASAAR
jgi:hypothetical protein